MADVRPEGRAAVIAEVWSRECGGVRVQVIPSRPEVKVGKGDEMMRTQRWLPPHVSVTYLAAPMFEEPAAVLALIDVLAAAGIELQEQLANYHSGVLL